MLLRPRAIPGYFGWGLRFLAASASHSYYASTQANYRLCAYSLERLRAWRTALGLEYAVGTLGTLEVYRDPQSFQQAWSSVTIASVWCEP